MPQNRTHPRPVRRRRTILPLACALVAALGACSGSTASTTSAPGSGTAAGSTTAAAPGTTTASRVTGTVPAQAPGCVALPVAPWTTRSTHVDQALASGGLDRTYKWYAPASVPTTATASTEPVPLVVDLHGYSEGNAVHTAMSELGTFSETAGFVLATPSGRGKIPYWNSAPTADGPADVQFVSDVIDDMARHFCVDRTRVFVTGLSNGAFMTSLVGCTLADKVAAIAPVAGLQWPDTCAPARPIPVVAFHGTADQFVTYDGSPGPKVATLPIDDESKKVLEGLKLAPIPDSLARWASFEGCAATPTEKPVTASVKLISYDGCKGGSTVELYLVDGGGHTWPGSAFSASIENVVGKTTTEISANELMWAFFQQHPLPQG